MIPYCYFDYLRSQQAFRLVPIFHHSAIDILSFARLTAIVPLAFRAPDLVAFRHGADLIGLARWLLAAGREEEALHMFRRAVDLGLPDLVLFKTLWDAALLERHSATWRRLALRLRNSLSLGTPIARGHTRTGETLRALRARLCGGPRDDPRRTGAGRHTTAATTPGAANRAVEQAPLSQV
jgi:hypothetical protein